MRHLILSCLACALFAAGCSTVKKNTSSESYVATSSVKETARLERIIKELRDSLMMVKAPAEQSESRGLQNSLLETSLAWSTASIDSTGFLNHTIANKDSIPSKIVYNTVYHTLHDTVYINQTDTLRLTETKLKERELSPWQRIQIRGFWTLVLVVGFFIVRSVKKRFL